MAENKDTTLHRRYLKSFLPLILLLNGISFLFTGSVFILNSSKQYDEVRSIIKEVVGINFSLLDDINVLYDYMFSREMEGYLLEFRENFEKAGNNPDNIDLHKLKEEWGEMWDLYIIDDQEIVIRSTYAPDEGLDFRKVAPQFARRLSRVRTDGHLIIDNISREVMTDIFRKYGYLPSGGRDYILEIGLGMPIEDKLFYPVNPSNLGEKFDMIGKQDISIEILEFKEYENPDSPLARMRQEMKDAGTDHKEEWIWNKKIVKSYFNFTLENLNSSLTHIEYFICINYSLDSFLSKLKFGVIFFLSQLLLLTLITILIIFRLSLALTKPIADMVDDIRLISSGQWEHPISSGRGGRELNVLKGSVDQLVSSLLKEKSAVELYESRFRLAVEASRDIIMEWHPKSHFLSFSSNSATVFGLDPGSRSGRDLELWFYGLLYPESKRRMKVCFKSIRGNGSSGEINLELPIRSARGADRWILLKGYIEEWKGEYRMIGIIGDITQNKSRQLLIESLAYSNSISGFPNLQSLYETGAAFPPESLIGIVLLNLDDLGRVYTAFGYEQGHDLMKALCQKIKGVLSELGMEGGLFHINSDDLVLLCTGYSDKKVMEKDIRSLGEALSCGLFLRAPEEFFFTISLGAEIAALSADVDIQVLLHRAEMALDRAKAQGKNSLVFYQHSFSGDSKRVFSMTRSLSDGLQTERLSLVYQPIVDRSYNELPGFEALLRLEEGSQVSPAEYIMAAEDTGLIHPLGVWIMNCAVRQAGRMLENGLDFHYISINFSPLQFREQRLPENLIALCREYAVPPEKIQVELTETAIMLSADRMLGMISSLKDLGFRIAMDDFGTGYSSLAYLSRLPIDALKIDKGMTSGVLEDDKLKRVVSLIMEVARELSLEVIAEGIETKTQEQWMLDQGCLHHQGYLYSRPLSIPDMESWLSRRKINK